MTEEVMSVCDGIGAAQEAWAPLDWRFTLLSEIEPFPRAVLEQRHGAEDVARRDRAANSIPLWGDFTALRIRHLRRFGIPIPSVLVGGTPCFVGGTLIATRRGLTPIREVSVGDEVLTHESRWRRVVATGTKVAPTMRLKGQGQSAGIITTAEHPFYARQQSRKWVSGETWAREFSQPNWVNAQDMRHLFWASPAAWPESEAPDIGLLGRESPAPAMSEALAWVIGRWLGDGWTRVSARRGYALICCAHSEADALGSRITAAGLWFSRIEQRTTTRFQISSRALARWLRSEFGAGAATKTMPTWVFGWRHRRALLDGYISADGHSVPNGWRITTVSDSLALGAVLLGHSLGRSASRCLVKPSRETCVIEGRTVRERPFWQVTIYASSRSSVEIGKHRWGLVRSVEPEGEDDVFNLEVEGDNSYVADGAVVHNCQAFSVAGLRRSLDDDRGNLTLQFVRLANAIDAVRLRDGSPPLAIVWENVPGILSVQDGAFGCFLAALVGADAPLVPPGAKPGKPGRWTNAGLVAGPRRKAAWRILDTQHFGLPQRRRRVFVVASARDGFDPSEVLLERKGVRGDSAAGGEAQQDVAGSLAGGARRRGGFSYDDLPLTAGTPIIPVVAHTLKVPSRGAAWRGDGNDNLIAETLRAHPRPGSNSIGATIITSGLDGGHIARALNACETAAGRMDISVDTFVAHVGEAFNIQPEGHADPADGAPCLTANGEAQRNGRGLHVVEPLAFDPTQATSRANYSNPKPGDPCHPLAAAAHPPVIAFSSKDFGGDAAEELSPTLRASGFTGSHANGGAAPAVAYGFEPRIRGDDGRGCIREPHFSEEVAPTVNATKPGAVAFALRGREAGAVPEVNGAGDSVGTLRAADGGSSRDYLAVNFEHGLAPHGSLHGSPNVPALGQAEHKGHTAIAGRAAVRRLTPVECERLQGFPDSFTAIRWRGADPADCPDGPRYRACGNSMSTPVMAWIGRRLAAHLEAITP